MVSTLPSSFVAGDSLTLAIYDARFLASSAWSMRYELRGQADISFASVADGDKHAFTVLPAVSAAWAMGLYNWQLYAEKGATDRATVRSGQINILQNLSTLTGTHDARSHVQKVLEAIEAVIEKRATSQQLKTTIGGRTLERIPTVDLLALRDTYRREFQSEQAAAELSRTGQGSPGKVRVRF